MDNNLGGGASIDLSPFVAVAADAGLLITEVERTLLHDNLSAAERSRIIIALSTAGSTTFLNSSLGRQLENIAKIIQARTSLDMRRQIFFCATGVFDTYSDQLPRHASILGGVSNAMAAFYNETVAMGVANEVTAFTASDFS